MTNEIIIDCVVMNATNLPKMDLFGKVDGFVCVKCGSDKQETCAVLKKYNPEWNKRMTFHEHIGDDDVIQIAVYDKDSTRDELIGYAGIRYGGSPDEIGLKKADFRFGEIQTFNIWSVKRFPQIEKCRNSKTKCESTLRIMIENLSSDNANAASPEPVAPAASPASFPPVQPERPVQVEKPSEQVPLKQSHARPKKLRRMTEARKQRRLAYQKKMRLQSLNSTGLPRKPIRRQLARTPLPPLEPTAVTNRLQSRPTRPIRPIRPTKVATEIVQPQPQPTRPSQIPLPPAPRVSTKKKSPKRRVLRPIASNRCDLLTSIRKGKKLKKTKKIQRRPSLPANPIAAMLAQNHAFQSRMQHTRL